jgi:hypothetical protein
MKTRNLLAGMIAAGLSLALSLPALAAKTNFNGGTLKNAYKLPINAGDLAVTLTAADVANGNMFSVADGGILIMYNSGASPYTITINGAADSHGRTGDISAYSIPAGEIDAIWIPPVGIHQTSGTDAGKVYVSASNAAVKFAYLQEPADARAK